MRCGDSLKCTCESCNGTGIFKSSMEQGYLGIICNNCNGRGYYSLKKSKKIKICEDEKKKKYILYEVMGKVNKKNIELFKKIKKRRNVKYVIYGTGLALSDEYIFQLGIEEPFIISYSDFLMGKVPLPIEKLTCPRQLCRDYKNDLFDNSCLQIGYYSDCKKFDTQECWEKFYGDAKSIDDKQAVLKRIRKL